MLKLCYEEILADQQAKIVGQTKVATRTSHPAILREETVKGSTEVCTLVDLSFVGCVSVTDGIEAAIPGREAVTMSTGLAIRRHAGGASSKRLRDEHSIVVGGCERAGAGAAAGAAFQGWWFGSHFWWW